MKAGNQAYLTSGDMPRIVPLFPLSGALLLPGGHLPLNIFEKRYLAMIDDALSGNRIIGMIQPCLSGKQSERGPALCKLGCLGRLTAYQETGDGRYLVSLTGICRFHLADEIDTVDGYRRARIEVDESEFALCESDQKIDRETLLATFQRYLIANRMETDWEAVERTDDETLVTALCMMSPYGAAEKQALLEADDLKTRAETLVAITEIALARGSADSENILQ